MVLASDGSWSPDAFELAAATVTAIGFAPDTIGYAGTAGGSCIRAELPLFADGFESGTTDSWTAAAPAQPERSTRRARTVEIPKARK